MYFSRNNNILLSSILSTFFMGQSARAQEGTGNMVKMCLFYPNPSGHARTDPIITQTCASDHVHSFYGPQNFHPDTTYNDLLDTPPSKSSSPWVENQSLYWHPSIYRITDEDDGSETYERISNLETSPYYRWDNSVSPATVEFPPEFRMIAYSNDEGADAGGEVGENLFVECCNFIGNDNEECTSSSGTIEFPRKNCSFLGIAMAMPTCWNGGLGINNNHKDHMAYTDDGTVHGDCPSGYNKRLPQIQLFVRVNNYQGAKYRYTLSDASTNWHVDFMNGWKQGKLNNIIKNCPITGNGNEGYNPPCNCDQFLTENPNPSKAVCDKDVRSLILDEATDTFKQLPRTTCNGDIIPKSWDVDPPLTCNGGGGGGGCKKMIVTIKGDSMSFKHKNNWQLYTEDEEEFFNKPKKIKPGKQSWKLKCIPDECYVLEIFDRKGNGMKKGWIRVKFGDTNYKGKFKNGNEKYMYINCD